MLDAMLGAGKQPFTRAALEHQLEQLRIDHLGETPTPLERLLVDRIVLCWLACQQADTALAQRVTEDGAVEAEFHQRRAERAERRLLRAASALATMRRLGVLTVQATSPTRSSR